MSIASHHSEAPSAIRVDLGSTSLPSTKSPADSQTTAITPDDYESASEWFPKLPLDSGNDSAGAGGAALYSGRSLAWRPDPAASHDGQHYGRGCRRSLHSEPHPETRREALRIVFDDAV